MSDKRFDTDIITVEQCVYHRISNFVNQCTARSHCIYYIIEIITIP